MENLNRIKGALADAGKTGVWLAGQVVHQHHTTRFADAGKDFRIAKD